MTTVTPISQDQVTNAQSVRSALGLRVGVKRDFVPEKACLNEVPIRSREPSLQGRFIARVAKPVPLVMMDEAIAQEATAQRQDFTKVQA